jgi:hypothetical protein
MTKMTKERKMCELFTVNSIYFSGYGEVKNGDKGWSMWEPLDPQPTCENCRHSTPAEGEGWDDCVKCNHHDLCVCMPNKTFCCNEWEEKDNI